MNSPDPYVDQIRRHLLRLLTNDGDTPAFLPLAAAFAEASQQHTERLLADLGFPISYSPSSLHSTVRNEVHRHVQ